MQKEFDPVTSLWKATEIRWSINKSLRIHSSVVLTNAPEKWLKKNIAKTVYIATWHIVEYYFFEYRFLYLSSTFASQKKK